MDREGFYKNGVPKYSRKEIRDSRNFIVGHEVRDGNKTYVRDMNGCNVGWYDHDTDRTYKPGAIQHSYGNTALTLLNGFLSLFGK